MANSKKVRKKRTKQGLHKRRVDRQIVGLIMSWKDESPTTNAVIDTPNCTHRLSAMRPIAKKIWYENMDYLKLKSRFKWLVTVVGVFGYENKVDQQEARELEASCVLEDLAPHVQTAIADIQRHGNMGFWRHAEISIECIGV